MFARAAALASLAACGSAPGPDAPTVAWLSGPNLPLARLEPGVTALGQQLVVLGGFAPDGAGGLTITKQVDVLDVGTGQWSQLPDAPVARHHVQLAAIGTTLYLLGGLDAPDAQNNYPARTDCYALDTGASPMVWHSIASIPAGFERGSAGVVITPPRIYLIGGANTTSALPNIIFYDSSIAMWTTRALTDLPAPRSHPAAMRRFDGTFVVTGGLGGLFADSAASDTWQLMPTMTQWQTMTPMPVARGGCAYGVLQGSLACAGGEAGTSALKITESYDPITDIWTDAADMPASTAGTQGAAVGQSLYVPGGSRTLPTVTTGFEPTDTLFVFSPLNTTH
jgi:N-acetylneuraminic acid mutarotase